MLKHEQHSWGDFYAGTRQELIAARVVPDGLFPREQELDRFGRVRRTFHDGDIELRQVGRGDRWEVRDKRKQRKWQERELEAMDVPHERRTDSMRFTEVVAIRIAGGYTKWLRFEDDLSGRTDDAAFQRFMTRAAGAG